MKYPYTPMLHELQAQYKATYDEAKRRQIQRAIDAIQVLAKAEETVAIVLRRRQAKKNDALAAKIRDRWDLQSDN